MITAGLDIGTRTAKAVLLDDERILAATVRPVDDAINRIYHSLLKSVRRKAGVHRRRIKRTGITTIDDVLEILEKEEEDII